MRNVPETSGVLETNGVPTVADGPVAALVVEDPLLRGMETRLQVASTWREGVGTRHLTCHRRLSELFPPEWAGTASAHVLSATVTRVHPTLCSPRAVLFHARA